MKTGVACVLLLTECLRAWPTVQGFVSTHAQAVRIVGLVTTPALRGRYVRRVCVGLRALWDKPNVAGLALIRR